MYKNKQTTDSPIYGVNPVPLDMDGYTIKPKNWKQYTFFIPMILAGFVYVVSCFILILYDRLGEK
jgi:hypothetical protein